MPGTGRSQVAPKYFGCHVSAAGGLEQALANARELGVNTIQLHPSPPQRWNSKPFPPGAEDLFNAERGASGVLKVFFHGIYLINLASPDKQKFHMAKLSLVNDLDLNARIKGNGVVFHVGSLKDEPDERAGWERAAQGINWIFEHSPNDARLILEVAAGSGKVIGDKTSDLAEIYSMVENKARLGFGLDTQHMWASGYDWQNSYEAILSEIEQNFGLDKVWLIHLNDSMTALGSRKDRHENIGAGLIGREALRRIFTDARLSEIPFVLETPALKSLETAATEVEHLRNLA